jgi:hypothetical protein
MVSFMPWLLYPWGRSIQYPLDRKLVDPRAGLDVVVKREIYNNNKL